jgi:4-hydroxybenzoate polyprenyltransferase
MQLNVLLACGGASLAATAAFAGGAAPAASGVIVAFACVFAVYNFDRLADRSPAEGRSTPERRAAVQRWRALLRLSIVACAVLVVVLGAWVSAAAFAWTVAFPLLGLVYVLPLRKRGAIRRLKDVPYLKAFYAPACWIELVAVSLSHGRQGATPAVLAFAAFAYARLFISVNLGDLRDVDDDAAAGIRTLPQRLGRRGTLRFLEALQWTSAGGLLVLVGAGVVPVGMLGLLGPVALAYAIFRAYVRRPERHELLFELYDLELALYAPAWALASAWLS